MNSAPGNGSRTHGAPLPHFQSILFDRPESVGTDPRQEPPFFADLNLDQIVAAVTAGREEYALEPYLFAPLRDVEAVEYRHEVLRDLEHVAVIESIRGFAERMRAMRKHLGQAEELHHRFQKESWFLDAVGIYCDAVTSLAGDLARLTVASRGFRGLGAYLTGYVESAAFTAVAAQTRELKADLGDVRYAVHIRGNRIKVSPYAGEADYAAEVEATFARFKERSARDFGMKVAGAAHMDHVEAQVLEGVARLNPDVFRRLDEFCAQHASVVDPVVATFDREAQFYLAYLEHVGRLQAAGLAFCIPRVCARSTEVSAADAFDLALAAKLAPHAPVVRNDFHLSDPERILVVTGPNQGGKTTFARMFGQLHHLAGLGLPVPAREARLFLPDRIFTHFERDEDLATLRGKLEDELVRIHAILQRATSESVVVMNESFTSTTLDDALLIGTGVMTELLELGSLAVCVTFVDELGSLSEATVSMVGTVVPDDPAVRTYKIVRKPADGLAHAWAIAEKYGLTYERLKHRIAL